MNVKTFVAPIDEAKARHEWCAQRLQELQAEYSLEKARGPRTSLGRLAGIQRQMAIALADVRSAKQKLRALSGTDGRDPKWRLVSDAYAVLTSLEGQGIDIGERAQVLLEEIEQHVPMGRLAEAVKSFDEVSGPYPDQGGRDDAKAG